MSRVSQKQKKGGRPRKGLPRSSYENATPYVTLVVAAIFCFSGTRYVTKAFDRVNQCDKNK